MPLTPGTRLGPYEVLGQIGSGGMGDVYRARDSRLDRDVALKILPDAFAADPERLRRFEREAKTLASLNHPNIAQLYGIEGNALVMELVPGRTLAEIIDAGGALAPDVAIPIAAQIAEALEAAHEAGVVHRDLKPANVKRRDDDVVKVLDFGLARVAEPAGAAIDTASSTTMLSLAATQQGVILGTAGYMSPEQARGKVADKRSDIWAFGVVLFEMLTGRRLFDGDTVTEVIASVIKDAPRLDLLPAATPPMVRQLIARCLERDPRMRLRDIGEARVMLGRAGSPTGQDQAARSPLRPGALVFGAVAIAAVAALATWQLKPGGASTAPVRRFELPAIMADSEARAISRDGRRIAYMADGHLYLHDLQAGKATDLGPVPPASANTTVFFAPDGQRIGYSTESTIRIVAAQGGPPFVVCKVPESGRVMDAEWADDGTIYFAVWRDSVYRVPATGGSPAVFAAIDRANEIDFHSLAVLPGSRMVVVTHVRGQDGTRADLIDGGRRTPLGDELDFGAVRFQAPDRLVFTRSRTNTGAWSVALGTGKVDLTKAVSIEPGATTISLAHDGTLVSRIPPREMRELIWVSVDASSTSTTNRSSVVALGKPFESTNSIVALSHDGRRAAVSAKGTGGRDEFLIRDLTTGTDTRVPMPQTNAGMVTGAQVTWTPAGRLLYAAGGIENLQIYDWPSDGSGSGRPLVPGMVARMRDDGREVIFNRDERQNVGLYRAPVLADGTVGKAEPVFAGDAPSVRKFDISSDGTLLAFTINDLTTGQSDVFVTTYPDLRDRRQVTSTGGTQPRFSRDGKQLYFLSGTRTASAGLARELLQVVSVTKTPLAVTAPKTLYSEGDQGAGAPTLSGFDVAADGRLLMTRIAPTGPGDHARVVLLQNWLGAIGGGR